MCPLAEIVPFWESIPLSQQSPKFWGFLTKSNECSMRWNNKRSHSQLHPLVLRPVHFGNMVTILVTGLKCMSHPWGQFSNLTDIISHCHRHQNCLFNRLFRDSVRPTAFRVVEHMGRAVSFVTVRPSHTSFPEKLDIWWEAMVCEIIWSWIIHFSNLWMVALAIISWAGIHTNLYLKYT